MNHRTRSDKINNIHIALLSAAGASPAFQAEKFNASVTQTSLIGPHITLTTRHYTGIVTASQDGPVVTLDIHGIKQRFAEPASFVGYIERSLETAKPATLALSAAVADSVRVGNSVIFERRNTMYMCVEKSGMFEVVYNNQKMIMSHDDIANVLA